MNVIIIGGGADSESLRPMLNEAGGVHVAGAYHDAGEALAGTACRDAHAAFICLDGVKTDGFALAERLLEENGHMLIVFTAADGALALNALDCGAAGYLVQPFAAAQVEKIVRRLEKMLANDRGAGAKRTARASLVERGFIASSCDGQYTIHNLDDVLYFSVENRKAYLRTMDASYTLGYTIGELERLVADRNFFRCQKSYLVNIDFVESVDTWFNQTYLLNLKGIKERIPVSRMYHKQFKEFMFKI